MGAGKTCFAKGIASGLAVKEDVTSPTYAIISEYQGSLATSQVPIAFYHIDAYRLNGDDDFLAIGGEEAVFGNGVCVIEWSDRIPGFIPPWAICVEIRLIGGDNRLIQVSRGGNKGKIGQI